MKPRSIPPASLASLLLLLLLAAPPALANNPLYVTSAGTPYKWNSPVVYTVDGGNLGALSNAQANLLVAQAFGVWTAVPTTSLSISQNPAIGLGPDGNVDTVADFDALFPGSSCPNFNAVIYDSGGAITDGLFGVGASDSILGFADACLASSGDSILAMAAVLIVKPFTTSAPGTLFQSYILGVFIHEFGHGLGLGHSQVNVNCFVTLASCPSNTPSGDIFGVPTMFPILLPQTETTNVSLQTTLAADDISAISTLYPSAPSFATSTGTISGIIFFGDGVNHFQGGNVVARRVGDPRVTAVSNVSGMFAAVDHGNPALGRAPSPFGSPDFTKRGEYTIPGLPPGTYTVEVEQIDNAFTDGSSVGPQSPRSVSNPLVVPSLASHCVGGPGSPGDPPVCQNLVLAAGSVLNGNNLAFRDATPTLDFFDRASRNETIATATPLASTSSVLLSLSGSNDPDVDFYPIDVPAGQVFSVYTYNSGSVFDPVLDLMDANGARLTNCRIGDDISPFDRPCVDDDYVGDLPSGLNAKLTYLAASNNTVYLRVTDAFGDARPDFTYTLLRSLNPAQAAISFADTVIPRQFVGNTIVGTVTVVNAGSLTTTLNSPQPITLAGSGAGDFSIAAGTTCVAGFVLQPGGSCIVNLTFRPTAVGGRDCTLSVSHSAAGFAQVVALNAAGMDFSMALGGDQPGLAVPSATVAPGQSAQFPFFISANGALPMITTFSVSGLPSGAAGTFSRSSVPEGALLTSAVLTVTTSAGTIVKGTAYIDHPPRFFPAAVWFALLASALSMGLYCGNRFSGRTLSAGMMFLALFLCLGLVSCKGGGGGSGGSGSAGATSTRVGGTPAGTYTITITGTSGSVSRSTTVTLTVL